MVANHFSRQITQQLNQCLDVLILMLGKDLLGVYLYGSALVGGLQKYSDLDIFVVINRALTLEEKTKLIAELLHISGIYMQSSKLPIEMTIVEKSAVNPWSYPPHFDFQYGDWLRKTFEAGAIEPWKTYEMPDLAVVITQILLKSHTLFGLIPEQLLAPIPYRDFIKAMLQGLNSLVADLEDDTRNVLLTFARIWSTLGTHAIRSKPAAADWVLKRLPLMHQPVIERAKSICAGVEHEHWEDIKAGIKPCADFMLEKINEQAALINSDLSDHLIQLAQQ